MGLRGRWRFHVVSQTGSDSPMGGKAWGERVSHCQEGRGEVKRDAHSWSAPAIQELWVTMGDVSALVALCCPGVWHPEVWK